MLFRSESGFYNGIQTFKGAANRLELVAESNNIKIFKDFAHAPSKLKATVKAIQEQYPKKKTIACIELHTFSSLNKDFLPQYEGSFDKVDVAIVYYNPETLKHKNLPILSSEDIKVAFKRKNLEVFTNSKEVFSFIKSQITPNSVLLLMTSGNFNGLDINKEAQLLIA